MANKCKIPPKLKTTTHKSFETCKKVTFQYIRNTEKSVYLGERYGQNIEPRGTYLLEKESDYVVPGWETGSITFEKPLVIPHENTVQWKKNLVEATGKKGLSLSKYLLKLGFDGIVTVDNGHTSEIVDLRVIKNK